MLKERLFNLQDYPEHQVAVARQLKLQSGRKDAPTPEFVAAAVKKIYGKMNNKLRRPVIIEQLKAKGLYGKVKPIASQRGENMNCWCTWF